jgi:hypothetical protein
MTMLIVLSTSTTVFLSEEISFRETFPNFFFAYFFCGYQPSLTSKSERVGTRKVTHCV